jgi:hypothetical protein
MVNTISLAHAFSKGDTECVWGAGSKLILDFLDPQRSASEKQGMSCLLRGQEQGFLRAVAKAG